MLNGEQDKSGTSRDCRRETDGKPEDPEDEKEASAEPKPTDKTKMKLCTALWCIVVCLAVAYQVWSEIKWRTELREGVSPRLVVLPAAWLVFSNAIMATMWTIAMRLATLRQSWHDFDELCGPKLLFMRRRAPADPPDPSGRPTGTEKKGQRLLALLIEREKVLRSPPNLLD